MHLRPAAWCVAACLTCPAVSAAQTGPEAIPGALSSAAIQPAASQDVTAAPPPPVLTPAEPATGDTGSFWSPFKAIPDDFARFFSPGSLRVVGIGGMSALAAHQWDGEGIEEANEHLRPSAFTAGNIGGGFLVQTGASIGLYSIATLAGADTLSAMGADLVRAQVLSQGLVQAAKFATRRARPDGSDRYSLPSGHTASAFATATVLHRHFGWKAGLPAYGFGAYVAASRMSANKHHLSDVLLGATLGMAAARTVTIGSGVAQFGMGVAPTSGGAMVTFTKQ